MQTRPFIIAIIAFVLGLLIGSTLAPFSLWPQSALQSLTGADYQ